VLDVELLQKHPPPRQVQLFRQLTSVLVALLRLQRHPPQRSYQQMLSQQPSPQLIYQQQRCLHVALFQRSVANLCRKILINCQRKHLKSFNKSLECHKVMLPLKTCNYISIARANLKRIAVASKHLVLAQAHHAFARVIRPTRHQVLQLQVPQPPVQQVRVQQVRVQQQHPPRPHSQRPRVQLRVHYNVLTASVVVIFLVQAGALPKTCGCRLVGVKKPREIVRIAMAFGAALTVPTSAVYSNNIELFDHF